MGNLNQFYLMGRVARPPSEAVTSHGPAVTIAVRPGTGRGPRDRAVEPVEVVAGGPQLDAARTLHVGQGVLLRGHLRQEAATSNGGGSHLVARVQAIELLAGDALRRAAGVGAGAGEGDEEDGDEGAASRSGPARRRRRRGGRPRERQPGAGDGERPHGERPHDGGDGPDGGGQREQPSAGGEGAGERPAPAGPREPAPVARKPLPPPTPIAKPAPAPPPDPTYRRDMPF